MEAATAMIAFLRPRRALSRWNWAWRYVPLVFTAAHAALTSVVFSHIAPFRIRVERCLPALSSSRFAWLDAAADLVAPHPPDVRIDLAKRAARRIHPTFALCARDRAHLERALLRRLWPLT